MQFTKEEWPQLGYPLDLEETKSNTYLILCIIIVFSAIYCIYIKNTKIEQKKNQSNVLSVYHKGNKRLNQQLKRYLELALVKSDNSKVII